MKPIPPDSDKPAEQPAEEVQDYLDQLLFQATERPEAQVSQLPELCADQNLEQRQQVGKLKASPSLTMVAGTDLTATANKSSGAQKESQRPFAERSRPLAFKLPDTKFEPAPVIEPAPVTEQERQTPTTVVESGEAPAPANRHSDPVADSMPQRSLPQQPSVEPEPDPPAPQVSQQQSHQHQTTSWLDNGRPSWAQEPFECLLFSVGGLTLAVPLVELGTIYTMSEELTPIFGQIDWFMGLLPVKDSNIRTVNTAKLVMPERYTESMKEHFSYVISINGMDWGLAVDQVSSAITLSPDDVRWRGERARRPWLAGTVVEHMCALLDVSQLAAMFLQQDRTK